MKWRWLRRKDGELVLQKNEAVTLNKGHWSLEERFDNWTDVPTVDEPITTKELNRRKT